MAQSRIHILLNCFFLIPVLAEGDTVINTTLKREAVLGSAYNSDKQLFVGGECLQGPSVPTGSSDSSFTLDNTITERELENSLGFEVGARARFGLWEGSASANFVSRSVGSSFSVSTIYSAYYSFPVEKMVSPTKTGAGENASKDDFRWAETCSDNVVNEIRHGARIFVSVRVDFASTEEKTEFQGNFNISGPLAGANGKLEEASKHFGKDIRVTISAYQFGGDVSKLTKIFGDTDAARETYIQCTLGHLENCAGIIKQLLAYVGDTNTGFPSQLTHASQPGPAVLYYGVAPYSAYGLYPTLSVVSRNIVTTARATLQSEYENVNHKYTIAARLLARRLPPARKQRIDAAAADLRTDLTTLFNVSNTCYDIPAQCPKAVEDIRLHDISETVFQPPSFSDTCTEAIKARPSDPARKTVFAMIELIDPKGSTDLLPVDCKIYNGMLKKVTALQLSSLGLTDISPLEGLTGLQAINISNNEIADISSLAALSELVALNLNNNKVSDLSALDALTELKQVFAASNRLVNLGPLSQLTQLTDLDLQKNRITDLSPLGTLTSLQSLSIASNDVSDISPLKGARRLQSIDLTNNLLTLKNLTDLCKDLPALTIIYDDVQQRKCPDLKGPE